MEDFLANKKLSADDLGERGEAVLNPAESLISDEEAQRMSKVSIITIYNINLHNFLGIGSLSYNIE